jgi:aspartokinase/homoserine dehydrogenase 1
MLFGRNGGFQRFIFATPRERNTFDDVDGVMSANPTRAEALVLEEMSYDEAMELAFQGWVIHPGTMAPAVQRGLPIYIRNTFRPELPGTRIHAGPSSGFPVKGLATIESISLLNL